MKLSISIEEADLIALKDFLIAELAVPGARNAELLARVSSEISRVVDVDSAVDAKVTTLLSRITGISADLIKNEHFLQFHLGMGPKRINALAGPLTLIAQSIKKNAGAISITEASQLTTVQSCIDVIKKKLQ